MVSRSDPFGTPADVEFNFDLTGVESSGRVPVGVYKAEVTDVIQDFAQESGNPMYVWDFTIIEGDYTGNTKKLFTSLSEKALWKLEETLQVLGLAQPRSRGAFKRSQAIGRKCNIVIELGMDKRGREQASIARIEPLSETHFREVSRNGTGMMADVHR